MNVKKTIYVQKGKGTEIINDIIVTKPTYPNDMLKFCQINADFRDILIPKIVKRWRKPLPGLEILQDHSYVNYKTFDSIGKKNQNVYMSALITYSNHKGTAFMNNNYHTTGRLDPSFLPSEINLKKERSFSIELKHSELFLLNNLILDAPRHNKSIIVTRTGVHGPLLGGYDANEDKFNYYRKRIGQIVPASQIYSTGLYQATPNVIITIPPNFPCLIYNPECGDPIEITGEGSEVTLPYTTDRSGRTFTYGFRINNVENRIQEIEFTEQPNRKESIEIEIINVTIEYLKEPIKADFNRIYGDKWNEIYKPEEHDKVGDMIQETQQLLMKGITPPFPRMSMKDLKQLVDDEWGSFTDISLLTKSNFPNSSDAEYEFYKKVVPHIWELYIKHDRIGILKDKLSLIERHQKATLEMLTNPQITQQQLKKFWN